MALEAVRPRSTGLGSTEAAHFARVQRHLQTMESCGWTDSVQTLVLQRISDGATVAEIVNVTRLSLPVVLIGIQQVRVPVK